ncbi:MAG TPA: PHB depolymerase family esterase [Bacteroidota bacterium]|nr:PHB depolymerase family esterase [Bacteroidota bacterium]
MKFTWFILSGVFLIQISLSQENDARFLSRTFTSSDGRVLPYRLFVPPSSQSGKTYPLILWLHGAAGRGTDNMSNISGANELGSHFWISPANQKSHPCFVLAPQCPDTSLWVANDGRENPPDELDLVAGLLTELEKTYSIDTNRVYVVGQSMGGIGTWEILERYPDKFAAGIPLCGLGDTRKASLLTQVPIWAFHGAADSVVDVSRAREMIGAIRKAGGHPKYTEYKDVGHDVWTFAFGEPSLITWVFSQHRQH